MTDAQNMEQYKGEPRSASGELNPLRDIASYCIDSLSRCYTPKYRSAPEFHPSFDGHIFGVISGKPMGLRYMQRGIFPRRSSVVNLTGKDIAYGRAIDFRNLGGTLHVDVWDGRKYPRFMVHVDDRILPLPAWVDEVGRCHAVGLYVNDFGKLDFKRYHLGEASELLQRRETRPLSGYRGEGFGTSAKVFSVDIQGKTAEEIDKVKENLCKALSRYFGLMDEEEAAARAELEERARSYRSSLLFPTGCPADRLLHHEDSIESVLGEIERGIERGHYAAGQARIERLKEYFAARADIETAHWWMPQPLSEHDLPYLQRLDALERKMLGAVDVGVGEAEQLFEQGEYALVSKKLREVTRSVDGGPERRVIVRTPGDEIERRIENLEERLNGVFDGRIKALREEVNRGEISRPEAEKRYLEEIEHPMMSSSLLIDRFHYVYGRCVSLRDAIQELSREGRKEKKKAGDGKWSGAENAGDEMVGDAEAAVQGAHRGGAFAGKIKEYLFMDVRKLWGRLFSSEGRR